MNWPGAARGGAVSLTRTSTVAGCFLAACLAAGAACYTTGDGTAPPTNGFYFPTGVAVSPGGKVLYVANSDFDLQYNGGTLQSYDLGLVRHDAARFAEGSYSVNAATGKSLGASCADAIDDAGNRVATFGQACAPPVSTERFWKAAHTIGAFATDLQVSVAAFPGSTRRLFTPVRGNSTLTWAEVADDSVDPAAPADFGMDCGLGDKGLKPNAGSRCTDDHLAGLNATDNTRGITMPGEPFGMAQTQDGKYIAITHQSGTQTSLYDTGFGNPSGPSSPPSLQFVLDGVAVGGNGITSVPLDPDAFVCDPSNLFPCTRDALRPAFLETSRAAALVTLLRFYSDIGDVEIPGGTPAALLDAGRNPYNGQRPFLAKEATYSITANASGVDSRGIAIDPSARIECKMKLDASASAADKAACARLPARVFIANRSPASLLIGDVGDSALGVDGAYDATKVSIHASIPLTIGPSRIYLAPVVADDGILSMRLFIVCFDSDTIYVFNPETNQVENIIRVGSGPFAMGFDPFTIEGVVAARLAKKPVESGSVPGAPQTEDGGVSPNGAEFEAAIDVKKYRFAYIASFTKSYVQVLDLDNARTKVVDPDTGATVADKSTFETVVFNLGIPQIPKGSQ